MASIRIRATMSSTVLICGLLLSWCWGLSPRRVVAGQAQIPANTRHDGPQIGNVTESFRWGQIDHNIPLLLGDGDIGGLFDPFGGTTYDELRYGTGRQRDIRTLFLTQLTVPDYWVLEDQADHFLDPRYYRPALARKYLAYGAPFNILLRPVDKRFPEAVKDHEQRLNIAQGILTTRYSIGENTFEIESFILPSGSLLVYCVKSTSAVLFKITGIPSPPLRAGNDDHSPSVRYQQTKNGYTVYEPDPELVVIKQVSNVFCPAYAAVSSPGGTKLGHGFLLPPGEHFIFVAIGHQALGNPRTQAVDLAREAARAGYAKLRAEQVAWWHDFWSKSYVVLPDKRLEQMWYRSIYYLACCLPRRVPSFSPEGVYGDFPALAGFHPQDSVYHLFAAISSNHPELCKAQVDFLLQSLPIAEATARNVYFLPGARYPWQATPGLLPYLPGHANDGYYLHEHHVDGWIAEFVRRYLNAFGWNPSLTDQYYPILREIARFFSGMLTPRGSGRQLEITYVPSAGQEEAGWDLNQRNIFDMVVSAKWCLMLASKVAQRLAVDRAEAAHWADESSRISLSYCLRANGVYGSFEGDEGHHQKVPSQLIGVVMTSLFENNYTDFLKTYEYMRNTCSVDACSWSPGYYAISADRLKKPEEALSALQEAFKFSHAPWILFVENVHQVPGRLPYYLAAHALFVEAIDEMLLQDWSGKIELFPSCPFRNAKFKLRGNNRIIEAQLVDGKIKMISDRVASARTR